MCFDPPFLVQEAFALFQPQSGRSQSIGPMLCHPMAHIEKLAFTCQIAFEEDALQLVGVYLTGHSLFIPNSLFDSPSVGWRWSEVTTGKTTPNSIHVWLEQATKEARDERESKGRDSGRTSETLGQMAQDPSQECCCCVSSFPHAPNHTPLHTFAAGPNVYAGFTHVSAELKIQTNIC
jgi:hypothetical protein